MEIGFEILLKDVLEICNFELFQHLRQISSWFQPFFCFIPQHLAKILKFFLFSYPPLGRTSYGLVDNPCCLKEFSMFLGELDAWQSRNFFLRHWIFFLFEQGFSPSNPRWTFFLIGNFPMLPYLPKKNSNFSTFTLGKFSLCFNSLFFNTWAKSFWFQPFPFFAFT